MTTKVRTGNQYNLVSTPAVANKATVRVTVVRNPRKIHRVVWFMIILVVILLVLGFLYLADATSRFYITFALRVLGLIP